MVGPEAAATLVAVPEAGPGLGRSEAAAGEAERAGSRKEGKNVGKARNGTKDERDEWR